MKVAVCSSAQGDNSLHAQDTDCLHLHREPGSREKRAERTEINSSPRKLWILVAAMRYYHYNELPVFTVHIQIAMQGDGLSE